MRLRSSLGSQLIEFALLLPILLVLVFGIIDFSLAMFDKAVVTNASREGARAGIVFAPTRLTAGEIETVVRSYCADHLVTFGATNTIGVSVTGAGAASGSPLTVTVTYEYEYAVISRFIPSLGTLPLQATAVMRME